MIVEIVLQSSSFDRECDEQLRSFSEEVSTSNFLDLKGMLEKQYFPWLLFYHCVKMYVSLLRFLKELKVY